jgi:hypothetical protein
VCISLPAREETLLAGKLARSSHEAIADGAAEFVTAEFVSAVRAGHGNFVKDSNALYVPQTAMKPLPVLPRIAEVVWGGEFCRHSK